MNKLLMSMLFLTSCSSCAESSTASHTELWHASVGSMYGNCGSAQLNLPNDILPGEFDGMMAASIELDRFRSIACIPSVNDGVIFARCTSVSSDGKLFGNLKYDGSVSETEPGMWTAIITVDFAYGDGSGGCHGIYDVIAQHTYDCPLSDGACTSFKPGQK